MTSRTERWARRLLAALLALCLSAAAAPAQNRCAGGGAPRPDDGLGGTGLAPSGDDSGLGGTGDRPRDPDQDDSGVGGTGVSAQGERGVIGTITGFASICVDGVEIHYDAATAVRIDGAVARAADLAVGQVVEVVASGTDDALRAAQVSVQHIVVGPVTGIVPDGDALAVMGQMVRLSPATRGADGKRAVLSDFPRGSVVQVSGLRESDGIISASLVRPGAGDIAWLSGAVSVGADGGLAIAGTRLDGVADARLAAGAEVRVSGRWDEGVLRAAAVEAIPRLPFDGRVARLQIEGFASPAGVDRLRVGAYVFELPDADAADALRDLGANARVRLDAVVRDQRAVVERVGAAPDLPPRPERGDAPRDRPRGAGAASRGGVPPDRPAGDGRGALPERPPDAPRPAAPDRPDRPAGALPPERPPRIDRPPIDRNVIPDRPPRPPRP